MYKKIWLCLLLVVVYISTSFAQEIHRTRILHENIKTLRVRNTLTNQLVRPMLELNGADALEISFDELSHDSYHYTYTVQHCNADWSVSDLNSSEYLGGFTTADIYNYAFSESTTQNYTHYSLTFPNDEMYPKISGNYVMRIYQDGDVNNVVAWVCFSVTESLATIQPTVRYNTDIELNKRYQQVDFDVMFGDLNVRDPFSEVKVLIRQNNRIDNEVLGINPTFVDRNRLKYINNKELIFEGGNEYRRFDIASRYILGIGIDKIDFDRTYYHVMLTPSENLAVKGQYTSEFDVNGQWLINAERASDSDVQAEYMWVHFFLPAKSPFFEGVMYVGGDLTYNTLSSLNRMTYDAESDMYYYTQYLKQGGYNYQYWLLPKGSKKATLQKTEGSFWQTINEYTIYVYYRAFGDRYDRLVGYKSFTN